MFSVFVIKFIDIMFYEIISCFFFFGKNCFNVMIYVFFFNIWLVISIENINNFIWNNSIIICNCIY